MTVLQSKVFDTNEELCRGPCSVLNCLLQQAMDTSQTSAQMSHHQEILTVDFGASVCVAG